MATIFKVGDRVKAIKAPDNANELVGMHGTVINTGRGHRLDIKVNFDRGRQWWCESDTLQLEHTTMSIKEKFVTAFMKEPEKSFRKAEITNGDGFLTADGTQVFLGWLLAKHGVEFKKDVVDGLLEDEDNQKKD